MNPRSKSRFLAVEKCRCAWPPARDARRPKAPPWPLHAPTAASSAQPLLSRLGGAVIEQRIDDGTIRDLPSAAAGRNARHHPFQTPQIGNLAVNCGDMIVEAETEFAPAADECEPFVMDRRRALWRWARTRSTTSFRQRRESSCCRSCRRSYGADTHDARKTGVSHQFSDRLRIRHASASAQKQRRNMYPVARFPLEFTLRPRFARTGGAGMIRKNKRLV